jgi:hypothetical protein
MKAAHDSTAGPMGRPLDIIRPGDGDPRHGTRNGYSNQQCRCDECRAAWATYARDLRRRKREALGAA